ncbi:tRNA (uracil-5-)-methyltransferase like protein A [Astathelohania contejeani]|uniref:tRNA (Uracil-5-)-methyltransferase like protein A n=1 Tax=Astathelohania contejeani TaxID=164912 RepID=A0ABQ7HWI3_9MICR|nr:tRNA (uracil-5-)-methyltransferase like protein A [Thelohania contejeani]
MNYKIKGIPKYYTPGLLKEIICKAIKLEGNNYKLVYKKGSNYAYVHLKVESPIKEEDFVISPKPTVVLKFKKIEEARKEKVKTEVDLKNIDIRDVVTPMWKLDYKDQLDQKSEELTKCFSKLYGKKLYIEKSKQFHRNNCQFAFGFDIEGKPILGFRGTSFVNNKNLVFSIEKCLNVSNNMKTKVNKINELLGEWMIYDRNTGNGYLKLAMMREIGNEEICLVSIKSVDKNPKEIIDVITQFPFNNLFVQFDESNFEGFKQSELLKIRGESALIQEFMGFKFSISPFSFFQTNIFITELLVNKIIKMSSNKRVLLDLCCGTGIFSIVLSKYFTKCIGIDLNESCIKDAIKNKELNSDLNNVKFLIGDVEKTIEYFDEPSTAILDPPRAGVSKKTIQNIRASENIKEIFYISCNYKGAYANIEDLCRAPSNSYKNMPFSIVGIWGFDMFPNTNGVEVLFQLKRE